MYLLAVVLYNFLNQSLEGLIFMNERIRKLTELTLKGEMYAHPTKTEYDREDLFLSRQQRESKQRGDGQVDGFSVFRSKQHQKEGAADQHQAQAERYKLYRRFAASFLFLYRTHKVTSLIFFGSTIETELLFLSVSSAVYSAEPFLFRLIIADTHL